MPTGKEALPTAAVLSRNDQGERERNTKQCDGKQADFNMEKWPTGDKCAHLKEISSDIAIPTFFFEDAAVAESIVQAAM